MDPTMARIGEGMELGQRGERETGRRLLAEIWDGIGGEAGDPQAGRPGLGPAAPRAGPGRARALGATTATGS